ncbi:hypothetical protein [Spongiimicrobium salis]|uniref:hypothetical protein n=1 Tax=Spongiimicrobium salis TaxID=1667022 RepID=UPI00374D0AC6
MKEDFSTPVEMLYSAIQLNLYKEVVEQLTKDFNAVNIAVDFSEVEKPEKLVERLHEKVYVLLLEKFDDYLNVLYRIDVPEKAFKSISLTDVVEVAKEASFLILKREFQKVQFRNKYTS